MPNLNLTWIDSAPIKRLNKNQAAIAIRQLKANMVGWGEVDVPDPAAPDDINQRDWKEEKRTQQECWNDRIDSTNTMLDMTFDGLINFGYYIAGQPIAVLSISEYAYIEDLVTHPGSANAGGIMIEYAVNISEEELGEEGKLELYALDDDAQRAYQALGFEGKTSTTDKSMKFDPRNTDKWAKVGGKWCIAKYSGMKYVGGVKPLPPIPRR